MVVFHTDNCFRPVQNLFQGILAIANIIIIIIVVIVTLVSIQPTILSVSLQLAWVFLIINTVKIIIKTVVITIIKIFEFSLLSHRIRLSQPIFKQTKKTWHQPSLTHQLQGLDIPQTHLFYHIYHQRENRTVANSGHGESFHLDPVHS